jgi:predicted transport protein
MATGSRADTPVERNGKADKSVGPNKPRTMAQWAQLVREAGITDYDAACAWLRKEQGFTSNYAMMVASIATMTGGFAEYGDELQMLDAMYGGAKEHLRPIFDKLYEEAQKLGDDVELAVCKTQASFRRSYQFAIVRPSNKTTVDLSLALPKDTEPTEILQRDPTRDADDRAQWRIRLNSVKDVSAEVRRWLKLAYKIANEKRK